MHSLSILLTLLLTSLTSAQFAPSYTILGTMPATVIFVPYKLTNCSMSTDSGMYFPSLAPHQPQSIPRCVTENPYSHSNPFSIGSLEAPSAFAVTSGHCYNATYGFHSYFGATNWLGQVPCAMTIFGEQGCTGTTGSVDLNNTATCSNETMTAEGQSFRLSCGP